MLVLCSPLEGPRQVGEIGRGELSEVQQRQMQILDLGKKSPRHQQRLGPNCWEAALGRRTWRVLVHTKLSMSQQCPGGQEGQWDPGLHQEVHW